MTLQELRNYINENDIFADVYETASSFIISIEWGDWKHDHLYLTHLMKKRGYKEINCVVTEENGSDCYSAEHYFRK